MSIVFYIISRIFIPKKSLQIKSRKGGENGKMKWKKQCLALAVCIVLLEVIGVSVSSATGNVVRSFPAPEGTQPNGLAWDGSNLWMSSYMLEGGIYKLDPVDGSVLGVYTPPTAQYNGYGGLTYDGTYLWQADSYGGGIYKLSPSDCSIISTIPSPDRYPSDLAWDGSYLWVCGYPSQKIYKISPVDGSIVAEFNVPEGTGQAQTAGLAYDGEYLWLSGTSCIFKLDPSNCEVVSSFEAPCSRPDSLAWDGEYLWCASFDEGMIYQIDVSHISEEPTVTIETDKFKYSPGDVMTITLAIANPTENSVMFQWYWGVPQYGVWVPVMSAPIPAGYDDTVDFSFPIPNWGPTPFGNVFYVRLRDASGKVLDTDVAYWLYSPSREGMQ